MKHKKTITNTELLHSIRSLIVEARTAVARSVNYVQVWTNFHIGRMIVEHEQKGAARADYAAQIIPDLSKKLSKEFGRGFATRNLAYMRQFYLLYSDRILQSVIAKSGKASCQPKLQSLITKSGSTSRQLFSQLPIEQLCQPGVFALSWTHYLFLMSLDNPDERSFYEIESATQNWSIRELRRQFNTSLYERLALSRNKTKVKELSRKGHIIQKPEDAIKEPIVLEFLGLDEKTQYTETLSLIHI